MKEIQTTEELCNKYKKYLVEGIDGYKNISGSGMFVGDVYDAMVEFAKLHVESALKAASDKYKVDKDSILSAYPLTNIK